MLRIWMMRPSPERAPAKRGTLLVSIVALSTLMPPATARTGPDAGMNPDQPLMGTLATVSPAGAREADERGLDETPLMIAVRERRSDTVIRLLAAGADPDRRNRSGETSLHLAVDGDPEILRRLLGAGANPDTQDSGGVTPVMLAAAAGREDSIAMLQQAGARLRMKDYQGGSVRDWAQRGGHPELAGRLDSLLSAVPDVGPTRATEGGFAEDVFVDVKFPDWFKTSFLDLREDLDEALDSGKQGVLLFISASRCSYCQAFMDRVLADLAIRERLVARYDVIGLDIFDDSEMTAVDGKQYRVKEFVTVHRASYTPTMVFIGKGGRVQLRIVGYYPRERFLRVLDYLETGAWERTGFRDYLEAVAPSSRDKPMIADELFSRPPYMLDRRVIPAERPLLVLFERPGCEACERFHRRVLDDASVRRLARDFEVVQLDASDGDGRVVTPEGARESPRSWYRRLGLSYYPAILFFDERGREVMRLDSETLRFRMEGSLQLVLDGGYERDAQLQRWRRDKAVESALRQRGM